VRLPEYAREVKNKGARLPLSPKGDSPRLVNLW
jgi:hypothetical protein